VKSSEEVKQTAAKQKEVQRAVQRAVKRAESSVYSLVGGESEEK
jgi:hypothetical protein